MGMTAEERLAHYRKKAAEVANKQNNNFGRPERWKPEVGQNRIRIIPPYGDRLDWEADVQKSWNVGPNFRGPIVRPDQFGKPDPVADLIAKLQDGDEADRKRAEAMKAKGSIECFIIDRNNEAAGPLLYTMNWTVYNQVIALFCDSDYGDITHPETGTDLKINYTPGKKKPGGGWSVKPEYTVFPARESTPLGVPEALETDLFKKYRIEEPNDYEFIVAVIEGTNEEYVERLKQARKENSDGPADPPPPEQETPAPKTSANDEAVKAELEAIRKERAAKKAAKEETPSAPPPAPKEGSKEEPETACVGTPADVLDQKYWVVKDGTHAEATGWEIQERVDDGEAELVCMLQTDSDWSNAAKCGFIPSKSQVGRDLEEAAK